MVPACASRRAFVALVVAAGWIAAAASAGASAPTGNAQMLSFRAPGRNIGCYMFASSRRYGPGSARCDILHRRYRLPPRPRSCPSLVDFGQGLIVTPSGRGRVVCAGDTAYDRSARVLPRHSLVVIGEFRCYVGSTGVECRSLKSGHGFFISTSRYRLY